MNASPAQRPDSAAIVAGLKDFQRRTVEYAFRRLYLDPDSTHRFLVADEVGLGKTLVAKGVIAKAVERLWDQVDRIDVIYVCSNADIARQNIDRLRLDKQQDFARATRATLLPIQIQDLASARVNFVSMTPGTSLEPRGGTGVAQERALLFSMLREHWNLREKPAAGVLRCAVGFDNFQWWIGRIRDRDVDPDLQARFLQELDRLRELDRAAGRVDLQTRFAALCDLLPRKDSRLDDVGREARRRLVAELRAILGRTCIHALRPDLVILDEFQRFKHLLDPGNEEAELAKSLFEYADEREGRSEAVRVLLLSATPYKMYTLPHEQANGEGDHFEDFVATYDFLVRHRPADNAELKALLRDYRSAIFRLGENALDELRRLKAELEERLRRVMARTERLAVTHDRSGMLRERPVAAQLTDADVRHYLGVSAVAASLDQGDVVEFWKSAPYLLNFMDQYQLKTELETALKDSSGAGGASEIAAALSSARASLLRWQDVLSYQKIDPANARLRCLLDDTVEQGLWKLLWLPPSLPYYELSGVYAGVARLATTKRLVFSSWKVVPKVIAAVVSHEAERRAIALGHTADDGSISIENSPDGRQKIAALLRFSKSGDHLTGMPVLSLIYPSAAMARVFDPAAALSHTKSRDEVLAQAGAALAPLLQSITGRWAGDGETDQRWYWAAPLLLDLEHHRAATQEYWALKSLATDWSGEAERHDADGESEPESAWAAHLDAAKALIHECARNGRRPLGAPPADLLRVLSWMLLGAPAVVALRSVARIVGADALPKLGVRLAAARVAWRLRNLFNLPEVIALIRGLNHAEPYWQRVLEYAADGCLQAVLDEYAHVLGDSLSTHKFSPVEAAERIAAEMNAAIGLRAARVGVDEIRVDHSQSRVTIESRRMRARFATRFGQEKAEAEGEGTRADHVRAAFNSPFWPYVLASTSVGQEGLDFHHYCHAIMHWNLPANPVDLEQREGRIHRFKGHAVRKNVALRFGGEPVTVLADPWQAMFQRAADGARAAHASELVPYWVYPHDDGAVIERHVPALPLSRDIERLVLLRSALALYRMVFGQPRQAELVSFLSARFPQPCVDRIVQELRIDLEPPDPAPSIPSPRPSMDVSA